MKINRIVITVPHSIPAKFDPAEHPYDKFALPVAERVKQILEEVNIPVEWVVSRHGREVEDENRPEGRNSQFRKRLFSFLDNHTLVVDQHSFPKGGGDFKDSQVEIFKAGHPESDKIVDYMIGRLRNKGWQANVVTNPKRNGHSDITKQMHELGYPAILIEVCEDTRLEDVSQAIASSLIDIVKGDYPMEKMQEKVKPNYELIRKKQRLRKLHEQMFGKEVKELKERIDTLYNSLKETVKPKREPKKEILFKINSLESKMDKIYFKETIRPKDEQKIKSIQIWLNHLYVSLNEYDDKTSVIGAGPVLPIMPEEREPRKSDPETHEKIVPQPGDQPGDKIEKDYPQAYGPNKQLEATRKRLFTMHEDMKGDKHSDSEFDPEELKMGTKHEMEHTDNKEIAKKTAKDHLLENPKYYTDLKKAGLEKLTPTEMEDKAEQTEFSTKEIQDDKKRNDVLMYAKELRNKANRTRATKMTEKQAPEGWTIVDWKDAQGNKWQDVVPKGTFSHFQMRVMQAGGVITKTTETESMDWNPMDNKSVELETLKEGYIEYNDPYFAMQALHILVANDIDVTPKDNRLYVSHKDEAKVRDIFKKLGYNTPMFQEKLKEYLEPHKGKLTDPISNAEEKHKFKTDAQRRKTLTEAERKYKNAIVDYDNLVKKTKADEPGPITALGAGIELGQAKSDIDYWFTTLEWAKKGYSFEAYNHFEISDIWRGEKMKENYNEKDWKKRLDIVAKQCGVFESTKEDMKQVASKGITQMKEKFKKKEEQINVSGEPDKPGPGKMVLRGEEKIRSKIEKMHEGIVKKEKHHPLWEPPKVDVNPELAKDWDPISAISGGNIIKTPEEKRKLTQEAERELKKAEDKYEKALQGKDPDGDVDGRRRERNYWFTILTWAKKGYKNP